MSYGRGPSMDTLELITYIGKLSHRKGVEIKGVVLEPKDYDKLRKDLQYSPSIGFHTMRIHTIYGYVDVYPDKYERR
jgi:hypothetical protein